MRKRKAERYPRIRNNQAFKQRVYELVGDEYTFLDSYRGSSIKIRCRHNTCGNVWLITPNNFLRGNRCPREKVARIAKHETTKNCEFIERVQLLVGNDYIFLEPYKNAHTKIAYFHKDCAHVHYMNPNNFLNGQRCPECYKYMANTRKWVAKRNLFFKKLKNKYRCLTTYISYEKPVTLLHLKCFKKWRTTPKRFVEGARCTWCYGYRDRDTPLIKAKVKEISNGEYRMVGEYKDKKTKITLYHKKCKRTFKMLYDNFKRGERCPFCSNKSRGENWIKEILEKNKINYISQKRFKECRNVEPLPFDFYLPDYKVCIEYDGEQHYHAVDYFGGYKGFQYRKKCDQIKDQFCLANNLRLLRIPYTANTIREIKTLILKFLEGNENYSEV